MFNKILISVVFSLGLMSCNLYDCLPTSSPNQTKWTICHKSGNKFKLLTIGKSALSSHSEHGDFIAPLGAKKDADCIIVVIPPVDTVIVPPVVIPPIDTIPEDTVVIPPIVIPPVIPPVNPPNENGDIIIPPGVDLPCLFDDSRPECQL